MAKGWWKNALILLLAAALIASLLWSHEKAQDRAIEKVARNQIEIAQAVQAIVKAMRENAGPQLPFMPAPQKKEGDK